MGRTTAAAAVLGLTLVATAGAGGPRLLGTVGPGFEISLRDAQGNAVTRLDPGSFQLEVDDRGDLHNFHLTGPGVDVSTTVEGTGKRTFTVTFREGVYRFQCDPHSVDMQGDVVVGNPPAPSPPPPPSPPPRPKPSAPVGARLVLTVGPGSVISLKTTVGRAVRTLRPGGYTVVVRDRSAGHNAHLLGAGVNRRTGVAEKVTRTWKVVLRKGTLTFQSDPQRRNLRGTVKIG